MSNFRLPLMSQFSQAPTFMADIKNLSAEPLGKLHSWIPHDLKAERVVFLPDACPGKSPLPTGTAVLTHQEDWRRFAVSDCGCPAAESSSERVQFVCCPANSRFCPHTCQAMRC